MFVDKQFGNDRVNIKELSALADLCFVIGMRHPLANAIDCFGEKMTMSQNRIGKFWFAVFQLTVTMEADWQKWRHPMERGWSKCCHHPWDFPGHWCRHFLQNASSDCPSPPWEYFRVSCGPIVL